MFALLCLAITGCGEPEPLLIGVMIPETGPASPYGRTIRQGVDLAIDDVNAEGKITGGRPLQAVYKDTKTSGNQAQVAFQELLDMQVPAIIGPGTSTVALSLVPMMNEHEIVMVSPSASSPRLTTEGSKWFYRVYPSDVVEGLRMASFCRDMFWTKIAIVATDDTFGQDLAKIFTERFEAGVREVVYRKDIPEDLSDEDVAVIVREVMRESPEAVYVAAYVNQTARLLKAFENVKDKPAMLGTSAVTREIVAKAGEAAEGFVFPQVFFDCQSPDPEVCAFVDKYRERFGEDPDNYAAHAYDAVRVLAKALEQPLITPGSIAGELNRLDHREGVTGRINFDRNGDVVSSQRIFAVLGGEIMPYEKFKEAKVGQAVLSD